MAVRREVVSLSQLLQRRKATSDVNGDAPQLRLPPSQPSPSPYGAVRQRPSPLPVRSSQQQHQQHQQHPQQRPLSQSVGAFDAESAVQQSALFSQSQETFDDFGGGYTSQSQCAYSQPQPAFASSQDERRRSYVVIEPSQASRQSERGTLDKELLERVTGLSAMLQSHTAGGTAQLAALQAVSADVAELRTTVQQLQKQTDAMATTSEQRHETLADESRAAAAAIKLLESSVSNVDTLLHEVADSVSELVAASRAARAQQQEQEKNASVNNSNARGNAGDCGIDSDNECALHRALERIDAARAKRRRRTAAFHR